MHDELRSLIPDVSRRQFVVTTLATGFALAVRPVGAKTITTDSAGLTAGEVKIPVKDGEMPAYRAMPEGAKSPPVVLVVHEIFGVHEHIQDLCRRLAKAGYLAVAPELYARQGDVSKAADIKTAIRDIVSKVPDAQVMSDLDATAAWAKSQNADTSKLAVTGFCWGGRIVWLYAAHNPELKCGVAWYGPLMKDKDELHPTYPLDVVDALKAPVLGLYAGQDQGIPRELIEKMRAALKAANSKSEILVYPDAQHGFNADYRPSYNEQAARAGWQKMLEWFAAHGVKA